MRKIFFILCFFACQSSKGQICCYAPVDVTVAPPSWSDVIYTNFYLNNLSNSSGVWSASGADNWLNIGSSNTAVRTPGQFTRYVAQRQSGTNHVVLGLTTTSTVAGYGGYVYGVYLNASGTLTIVGTEFGGIGSALNAINVGEWYGIEVSTGGAVKIIYSTDNKATWNDAPSGSFATSASGNSLYPQASIYDDNSINSQLFYPQWIN